MSPVATPARIPEPTPDQVPAHISAQTATQNHIAKRCVAMFSVLAALGVTLLKLITGLLTFGLRSACCPKRRTPVST